MWTGYSLLAAPAICLFQVPAPKISIDNNNHSFGKITPDKTLTHKFNITNNGDALLTIKEIRESCACSRGTVQKKQLSPGDTTSLEVSFNPAGMVGNVHKTVELLSDDPVNPKVQLTFTASVVYEIMPSNSVVFFNEISRYETAESTVRLESGNGQPVVIKEIQTPGPYITCETQKDGDDIIMNIKMNGQLIPKHQTKASDVLTVNTTSKKVSKIPITIEWNTQSVITTSLKRIIWNGNAGNELRTAVILNHSYGKSFSILGVKSTSPYIEAVNLSKNSAAEHKFDVIMTSKAKAGMYQEKLILRLDDPEQRELEIGIAAILR
jgi:hypothetical protein